MSLPVIHLDRSGGGTGTGWDGQVEFRADLPITIGDPEVGSIYLVEKPTTILFGAYTTYQSGLYIRDLDTGALSDWRRLNVKVKFTDAEFTIVSTADESKQAKFDLSLITTSTTRTYTYPNQDGTIALLSDISAHDLAAVLTAGNTMNDGQIIESINGTNDQTWIRDSIQNGTFVGSRNSGLDMDVVATDVLNFGGGLYSQHLSSMRMGASGSPSTGSLLDLVATDKGLLVPRVALTNFLLFAPIAPGITDSMLVYNTNAAMVGKFGAKGVGYYYWSSGWIKLSSGRNALETKSGVVLAASFTGTPKKTSPLVFTTPFADANYSIALTAHTQANTTFSIDYESRTATGFVINTHANNINNLIDVTWIAIYNGEN